MGGSKGNKYIANRDKFGLVLILVLTFFYAISYAEASNIKGYQDNNSSYNFVYFGGVPHGQTYSGTDSASDESRKYVGDLTRVDPNDNTSAYKYAFTDNDITKYAIRFRVLDTTSNDGITPALFMLTEYAIGERR